MLTVADIVAIDALHVTLRGELLLRPALRAYELQGRRELEPVP